MIKVALLANAFASGPVEILVLVWAMRQLLQGTVVIAGNKVIEGIEDLMIVYDLQLLGSETQDGVLRF
jgi:hypothetical protein